MSSERLKIWAGFLAIALIWGSTWLAIKIGLEVFPPLLGAAIRFLIASAILYAIVRLRRVPIHNGVQARKIYLIMGLFSFGIPYALVYWSEQYLPSSLASILFAAYPFWVALFSHLYLHSEPIDAFKTTGIILGFLGVIVIFWGHVGTADLTGTLAVGAMVLCTVLQASVLVFVKKHGQAISPFVMNFCGMSIGTILLFILSLLSESWSAADWSPKAVGSILYLAVFGSVVAFVAYYWLLKRVQAVYLSLTAFINPVIAVILGALILDETLGTPVAVGAVMVLAGILVANGKSIYQQYA